MNRSVVLLGAVVLVLILLAGGVYMAVQLLAEPPQTAVASGGGRFMHMVQVGENGVPVNVQTTILPAAELPDTEATASGIVLGRQDDTMTVGTGAIEVAAEVSVDAATGQESSSVVPSTSGPEVEVVLTRDTLLYRDVTDIAGQVPSKSGEATITQEVRPVATTEELEPQMEVQVWGQRRGDRIVAEVVVFGPLGGGAFE